MHPCTTALIAIFAFVYGMSVMHNNPLDAQIGAIEADVSRIRSDMAEQIHCLKFMTMLIILLVPLWAVLISNQIAKRLDELDTKLNCIKERLDSVLAQKDE